MTPDQLQAMIAIATIMKTVGTLPFGLILVFLIISPWIGMLISSNVIAKRTSESTHRNNQAILSQNDRINSTAVEFRENVDKTAHEFRGLVKDLVLAQEKRFESVVRMYENNVQVVKDYHGLAKDLTSIITLSTRTMESLVHKIDNNQFCPIARKGVGKE